jgi:hypothetical protein
VDLKEQQKLETDDFQAGIQKIFVIIIKTDLLFRSPAFMKFLLS